MALLIIRQSVLKCRKLLTFNNRNVGYVVLLPEIGDVPANEHLSQNDGLPEFNNVTIENCTASIAKQTLEFESGVKKIEKNLDGNNAVNIVEDVFEPLERLSVPLDLTWGIAKTLYLGNNTLIPTKTYLPIHERARRARSTKYNNEKIYEAVKKELSKNKEKDFETRRVLEKFSLEGKLNGLELDNTKKEILKEILNKISVERQLFKRKIDIQTQLFSHTISDYDIVRDFPKKLLELISTNSQNYMNGPWKVNLQSNIFIPTMQYCSDRKTRWNLWQAMVGRGSGYLDKERSTVTHMEEIRYQRQELAKLLGFDTFADMSMETKMARSVGDVKNVINTLLERAKPAQDREIKKLNEFAANNGFNYEKLELWDLPYWRRRQELSSLDFRPEEFQKYFPFTKVLDGLFKFCERMFGVVFKQRNDISTWHKDVKYYDVLEAHSSAPVAGFYLDPFSRKDQKIIQNTNFNGNGGWMVGIQNKSEICDRKPLASLIFNFDLPTNEQPCFLDLEDLKSLFFKFGHALQHLLTRTRFSEVSGLSNVEWDMVEVSGHVFTHFLYNKRVLSEISNDLPKELEVYLVSQSEKHMAGLDLCNELYLSAVDLEVHRRKDYWLKIVKDLWPQFHCFPLDKLDSHLCSFTQIFSEAWGAAYYSHVWSKMMAADIYDAFQETECNEDQLKDVGKRYRNTFLALGGSVDSNEIFRKFRGRDPSPEALLTFLGLKSEL